MLVDSLPRSWALITALEANPRIDLPLVHSASLHLAIIVGIFALVLRAILGRRSSTGISGDTLCAFSLIYLVKASHSQFLRSQRSPTAKSKEIPCCNRGWDGGLVRVGQATL